MVNRRQPDIIKDLARFEGGKIVLEGSYCWGGVPISGVGRCLLKIFQRISFIELQVKCLFPEFITVFFQFSNSMSHIRMKMLHKSSKVHLLFSCFSSFVRVKESDRGSKIILNIFSNKFILLALYEIPYCSKRILVFHTERT